MVIKGKFGLRAFVGGLLLLVLLAHAAFGKNSSGQIRAVAVSPDGKLLAVDFGNDKSSFIYKVPVDTCVAARLTNANDGQESSPSFSADGKRIAFTYRPADHRRSRIVIANADGSELHEWSPSEANDVSPVISPDGKTMVFSRFGFFGSYSPIAQPHAHEWNFYAADLDGGNVRQITNESFYMASAPSVSPDGKNMVVVAEGLETDQQIAIYSITHPGPRLRTLQPHVPNEVSRKHPILAYPNYLPDGSILFMAADKRIDYDVYRLDPDTGAIEKLTNRNGYATDLGVSADGRTAVFLKWQISRTGDLVSNQAYLLDLQSREAKPLKISGLR